jgi:hypothetical protein
MQVTPESAGVRVARNLDEVESLRGVWDQLGVGYVDAELDYFSALVRLKPGVQRPHVLVLDRSGAPTALVVARLEQAPLQCRFGYRVLYRPLLRTIRVAHGGVSGADDDRNARAVVQELYRALALGEADALVVPAVPIGSALHRALLDVPGALLRQRFVNASTHHRLVLPATFDAFLAARDRKSRYNLKRSGALIAKEFGDDAVVDVLSSPADHDRIFDDLERVAAKTYQRGLGAGFADSPERREQVRIALDRGWFRAWVLSVQGQPVAFWQGNVRNDTLFVSSTGFDPAFTRYGVGTFLQMRMLADMCADANVRVVDFGWGDADYKSRFGNESWLEQDVTVLAPSFRGLRVNAIRTLLVGADRTARSVLARTGLRGRVKRLWRIRLRPSA